MSNRLILWKYSEAEDCFGTVVDNSLGVQIQYSKPGDKLFICATKNNELFLLGQIKVSTIKKRRNGYLANCRNISGPFNIIPLGSVKWKLRFESDKDRLKKGVDIALQVRAHRVLEPESANMLKKILKDEKTKYFKEIEIFKKEGEALERLVTVRERDPKIRNAAIKKYGSICMICEIDYQKIYLIDKKLLEIHHLKPLATRKKAETTKIDDVIVLCPNCHRALHATTAPGYWKKLRRIVKQTTTKHMN